MSSSHCIYNREDNIRVSRDYNKSEKVRQKRRNKFNPLKIVRQKVKCLRKETREVKRQVE